MSIENSKFKILIDNFNNKSILFVKSISKNYDWWEPVIVIDMEHNFEGIASLKERMISEFSYGISNSELDYMKV